jgi:hypothetical protein
MKPLSRFYPAITICGIVALACLAVATFNKPATASSPANLYAELIAIQPQEAKVRYRSLSPDHRREYWRYRLNAVPLDQLNDDQAAFLGRIMKRLDGFKFDGTDSADDAKALRDEALNLFGFKLARAIFADLQDVKLIKVSYRLAEDCSCNVYSDWCGDDLECRGGSIQGCTTTSIGCGLFLMYPCDGKCRAPYGDGD